MKEEETMNEEEIGKAIRKAFHMEDAKVLRIWSFTGPSGCPVVIVDIGVEGCPLGFEHSGVPKEVQPWMRAYCKDENWESRWEEILKRCMQCQAKPRPSKKEEERRNQVRQSLFKRRRSGSDK